MATEWLRYSIAPRRVTSLQYAPNERPAPVRSYQPEAGRKSLRDVRYVFSARLVSTFRKPLLYPSELRGQNRLRIDGYVSLLRPDAEGRSER